MTPNNHWMRYGIPIAIFNGALFFLIAMAGGANLQRLFHFNNMLMLELISVGAALCYGMFTFKTIEFLTLKPKTLLSWILAIFAPFAASCYLTAGIEGASLFSCFNTQMVLALGIILFLLRSVNYIDGAVKFPDRLLHIKHSWLKAFMQRDYKALFCVAIVIYTTIGYSLSTTDAIYFATFKIAHLLQFDSPYMRYIAYSAAGIGAIVGMPLILYWSQRGLSQLTNCNKMEKFAHHDLSDIYTFLGLLGALPVILGSLGGATGINGEMFAKLGIFADVVRVTTSALFAVCAGVPGLSTLFRQTSFLLRQKKLYQN